MCYRVCEHALHPYECLTHLKELGADFKLGWLGACLLGACPPALDPLKQLVNSPWDDALLLLGQAHIKARPHGVGLPRTRLKHISSTVMKSHSLCAPRYHTSYIYVQ